MIAGAMEKPASGAVIGSTLACVLALQFANLKKSDRYVILIIKHDIKYHIIIEIHMSKCQMTITNIKFSILIYKYKLKTKK